MNQTVTIELKFDQKSVNVSAVQYNKCIKLKIVSFNYLASKTFRKLDANMHYGPTRGLIFWVMYATIRVLRYQVSKCGKTLYHDQTI